ncbi:DUF924-domain-containing protein [Lophiostoma macrostomum CBS 122681]|uniref:DUF924-domain-containing protein n=1 Tax=Lophiostoma macrostomum CBS 122681 TaxID=1314788 RepID=A0A6A6TSK9_9PLEO|nr:DUF924-domain-containing protein [Lophiostoma macrostomum CBS 122681]
MLLRIAPVRRVLLHPVVGQHRTMSSFTLNKDIWNQTLYKRMQDVWFEGVPLGHQQVPMEAMKRWFFLAPEERDTFDTMLREDFGTALNSIGPEKFPNPTAEPFLREIRDIAQKNPENDHSEGAWTSLSIILLLDQVPRNLNRSNEGLIRVYTHYDKISAALASTLISSDSPIGRADLHPQWRLSLPHRIWFYLPMVHTENIKVHKQLDDIYAQCQDELSNSDGYEVSKNLLENGIQSEKEHREILDRFGRYPHRNECLGRASTEEEKKFLEEGGATFGVAQSK